MLRQRQSVSELKKVFRERHAPLEESMLVELRFPETIHAKPICH